MLTPELAELFAAVLGVSILVLSPDQLEAYQPPAPPAIIIREAPRKNFLPDDAATPRPMAI